MIELIWGTGRRRIGLTKLQLRTAKGGLGVPDIKAYCYASQLQWLAFWLAGRNLQELDLTPADRNKGILHRLLLPKAIIPPTTPPLLKLAISYWRSATRYTKAKPPYAPNIPLLGIPTRAGVLTVRKLQTWSDTGVTQLGDFFADGVLMPHNNFRRMHDTPPALFILHAQISQYIHETWTPDGTELPTNALITMQYLMGTGAHLVKWITHGIRTERPDTLQSLREKWEGDTGRAFTDREWDTILGFPRKVSRSPKFKMIQLMLLHRAYLTPRRLHIMFPGTSDSCPRCLTSTAGLIHMIWDCPKLGHYWTAIHDILQTTAQMTHNITLEYYMLGLYPWKKKEYPSNTIH